MDPQVALTQLRKCGGFCRLTHLSRTTPPSLSREALQLYDLDVRRCFSSCTAVDISDTAWRQAILGLCKGGLGLHSLHAPAAYIAFICSAGFGSETNLHLCSAVADFNSAVPPDKALQIHSGPSLSISGLPKRTIQHIGHLHVQSADGNLLHC